MAIITPNISSSLCVQALLLKIIIDLMACSKLTGLGYNAPWISGQSSIPNLINHTNTLPNVFLLSSFLWDVKIMACQSSYWSMHSMLMPPHSVVWGNHLDLWTCNLGWHFSASCRNNNAWKEFILCRVGSWMIEEHIRMHYSLQFYKKLIWQKSTPSTLRYHSSSCQFNDLH